VDVARRDLSWTERLMASVAECEAAFAALAQRMAEGADARNSDFDRSLSCTLPDLAVAFGGRLTGGQLLDIHQVDREAAGAAKVRMTMSSDDLIAMVDGTLNVASAWASGRIRIDAGVFDLLKLRSIF
jgi:SCP-2 sterol transfer family